MTKQHFFSCSKVFFVVLAMLVGGALSVACDNGDDAYDKDVKAWCSEWIHCYDLDGGEMPYKGNLKECYHVMQWVKDHGDSEVYHEMICKKQTLELEVSDSCYDLQYAWGKGGSCSYTPFGMCIEGDFVEGTCWTAEDLQ
jgi:hypothetical protein